MKRKWINQKLRFEVFKRDDFKCQYCWRWIPDGIKLQVDHIIPVAEWGQNEIENLRTSCFDCNIWKWKRLLKNKQSNRDLKKEIKELKEQQKILQEYYKYIEIKQKIKQQQTPVALIEKIFDISVNSNIKSAINSIYKKYWEEILIESFNVIMELDKEKQTPWYLTWIAKNLNYKNLYNNFNERLSFYNELIKPLDKYNVLYKHTIENYEFVKKYFENYYLENDEWYEIWLLDFNEIKEYLWLSNYNLCKWYKNDIENKLNNESTNYFNINIW